MKYHLKLRTKVNGEFKVSRTRSECGKHILGNPTHVGIHLKTRAFKEHYKKRGSAYLCLNCIAKAKEQGRI